MKYKKYLFLFAFLSVISLHMPYIYSIKRIKRPKKAALPADVTRLQRLVANLKQEVADLKKENKELKKEGTRISPEEEKDWEEKIRVVEKNREDALLENIELKRKLIEAKEEIKTLKEEKES